MVAEEGLNEISSTPWTDAWERELTHVKEENIRLARKMDRIDQLLTKIAGALNVEVDG